ncbi:MAG: tetratricopeptide repeat protein [Acidobacteriaceae bacterium]|nr:tetratricopeptide repeat protein [Acidobacteriaceae bacterium]
MSFLIPASRIVGQAVTSSPQTSAPPGAMTVQAAHDKIKHGQEKEAIDALHRLVSEQPPALGANRELGIAYYRIGKLADAESSFASAMKDDPRDMESVQMRGLTLYRLGRPSDALAYLERARQWANATDVDANYVLGRCYVSAHRYNDARTAFATQYNLTPESGAAYLLISQMLLLQELPDFAKDNAEKALQLSPNIALAHFVLGKIYLAKGDLKHALEQFEQERTINPTYSPLYQFLGDVYVKSGEHSKAQHVLTEALSLDQSNTGPFIDMGRLFLESNDPQTAASYLQHAEQMDSSNFITHYLLAQAYRQLGKTDDAKRELDAVSKLHSGDDKPLQ